MLLKNEFPPIDTSYWRLDDKEWTAERKMKWIRIEKYYYYGGTGKSKKGMNIIKRYYLKGELPDFKSLKEWDNVERHLDLFSFLWLHPSRDREILTNLRNIYVNNPLIVEFDIRSGLNILYNSGCNIPTSDPENMDMDRAFDSDGYNLLMFDIIMGDFSKDEFPDQRKSDWVVNKFLFGYHDLVEFGKWLCVKKPNRLSGDCLYQYDEYLNYWLISCSKDIGYFNFSNFERHKQSFTKAFHRIHRFDINKEGNTARTCFVQKIRKILDEHEFPSIFKKVWIDVKNDDNKIKGLWIR